MSERHIAQRLHQIAEERVPASTDLWPAIRARLDAERAKSASVACVPRRNAERRFFAQSAIGTAAISLILLAGLWLSARLWLGGDHSVPTAAPSAFATLGVGAALPAGWTPTGTPTLTPTATAIAATGQGDPASRGIAVPASLSTVPRPAVAAPPASPSRHEESSRG